MKVEPRRIALIMKLSPGYNEGVVRGLAKFARPEQAWVFQFFERGDERELPEFRAHAGICCVTDEPTATRLAKLDFPLVNVGYEESLPHLPVVGNDDHRIGALAAEYFLARGFTSFAYFAQRDSPCSQRRETGFRERTQSATYPCARFVGSDPAAWLCQLPRRTAVFAFNDHAAAAFADACRLHNISLPEHLALLGADNVESLCLLAWPPISSIVVSAERIGFLAGQSVSRLLHQQSVDSQTVPPLGVITRRSSDLFAVHDDDVARTLRFISNNAGVAIRVADILKVVPVARRTLELRFRNLMGRTIREEIQRVRLETARQLLLANDWPISRVAVASGFHDEKRFTTVFTAYFGTSPGRYRRAGGSIAPESSELE